jgi:gliding motility-associated-like protein
VLNSWGFKRKLNRAYKLGLVLCSILFSYSAFSQTEFYFDTHNTDDSQIQEYWYGFVSTKGKKYNLTVEGTYSIWASSYWTDPCGNTESAARFPSKDGERTGTVGFDYEYMFALPNASECAGKTLPLRTTRFQMSLDDGKTWFHPASSESYQSNHVYRYLITSGGSNRIGIRQMNAENSDDYGKIRFILEPFPCDTPTLDLGKDLMLCPDDTITLSANTYGASYLWSDNSEDSILKITKPGKYWAKIETECFYAYDSIEIGEVIFPENPLGNDTTFCEGDVIQKSLSMNDAEYLWSDNSRDSFNSFATGGTYSVQIFKDGCTLNEEIKLRQLRIPKADLGEDVLLCEGADSYFKVEGDDITALWQDGSTESIHRFSKEGMYWVEIENICGFSSDSALVEVSDCNCNYFMPSAFTPNGDNLNSIFTPVFNCDVTEIRMEIFNRYGERVFFTESLESLWNGIYQGELVEQESYFYIVTVLFRTRQKISKKGVVTVLY